MLWLLLFLMLLFLLAGRPHGRSLASTWLLWLCLLFLLLLPLPTQRRPDDRRLGCSFWLLPLLLFLLLPLPRRPHRLWFFHLGSGGPRLDNSGRQTATKTTTTSPLSAPTASTPTSIPTPAVPHS